MTPACTWPTGNVSTSRCTEPAEWTVTAHPPNFPERSMHLCGAHARIGFKTAKAFHLEAGQRVEEFVTFTELGGDLAERDKRIMRNESGFTIEERRAAFRRHNRRTSS